MRIDFSASRDYECVFLGALGYSNRYIRAHTGLSDGQIGYRLYKKARISRMDFRDGKGLLSNLVQQSVRKSADEMLIRHLGKVMSGEA